MVQTPEPGAAVRGIAAGMTRLELPVEADKQKLLPVLPDQGALAGGEIEQIDIMPAWIPVVEADGDLVRGDVRPVRRHRANVVERRQIAQFGTVGINHEQMQVLIAVLVVEKHDVAAVRAPILPIDRPAPGARDRLPGRNIVNGRHPNIQHAVSGREPRDQSTVRRQFRVEKRRIIEQLSSRNQGAN
jgi:hypothetical protein